MNLQLCTVHLCIVLLNIDTLQIYTVETGTPIKSIHFTSITWGLILCSKKKILGVESHDFSQAEKEITAGKAEQIHKMTTIFTQNDNLGPF